MFAQATIAINAAGDGITSSAPRRKRGAPPPPRANHFPNRDSVW